MLKLRNLICYAIISALTYGAYYIWFDDDAPTSEAATAWDGEATQSPRVPKKPASVAPRPGSGVRTSDQ